MAFEHTTDVAGGDVRVDTAPPPQGGAPRSPGPDLPATTSNRTPAIAFVVLTVVAALLLVGLVAALARTRGTELSTTSVPSGRPDAGVGEAGPVGPDGLPGGAADATTPTTAGATRPASPGATPSANTGATTAATGEGTTDASTDPGGDPTFDVGDPDAADLAPEHRRGSIGPLATARVMALAERDRLPWARAAAAVIGPVDGLPREHRAEVLLIDRQVRDWLATCLGSSTWLECAEMVQGPVFALDRMPLDRRAESMDDARIRGVMACVGSNLAAGRQMTWEMCALRSTPLPVPHVLGSDGDTAERLLLAAGFRVERQNSPTGPAGIVIAQTPSAFSEVPLQTLVIIEVGVIR